jgi:hypothetical protein
VRVGLLTGAGAGVCLKTAWEEDAVEWITRRALYDD